MDLSIVIVSWNVCDLLRRNLKSIYNNTKNIKFEIFVVDNYSKDDTVRMVSREFPQINLIINNYNAGFSRAVNQALVMTKGRYVLLLNPDMRVCEGTLEKMVAWMDKNIKVGIAGCHLIKENGETIPHVRRFPSFKDQLAITLKLPHLFPRILDKYLARDFDYTKEAEVDSIRGSFFMIRQKTIKELGGLDERYFIWFEEVDYCRRAKNAGWKVMYTPIAQCVDYIGKSFSQVKRGKTQRYFRDSMLKYFQKWQPSWQYWLLYIAWPIGFFISWLLGDIFKIESKTKT